MSTRFDHLEFVQDDAVGVLWLDRPAKRNAINDAMLDEMRAFFSSPPPDVRAVVVTGRGTHFCSGLDLGEHGARSPVEVMRNSQTWHAAFNVIQFGNIPVVAALRGAVIGGGMELAAAAHVRVADHSTFFALPEGQRGIFVGGGGSVRVARAIGSGRMVELMLTGRRMPAREAMQAGMVHHLVENETSLAKAVELAKIIAGNAPVANYAIINAIARISDMSASDGLFTESLMAALVKSEDTGERIAAFLSQAK